MRRARETQCKIILATLDQELSAHGFLGIRDLVGEEDFPLLSFHAVDTATSSRCGTTQMY